MTVGVTAKDTETVLSLRGFMMSDGGRHLSAVQGPSGEGGRLGQVTSHPMDGRVVFLIRN